MTAAISIGIRPWRADETVDPAGYAADLADLVRFADNPKIAQWLTNDFPNPYTEADGRALLASVSGKEPVNMFAIEVDGRVVGSISIYPQEDIYRRNAELGYCLAEEYWGRGIVPEAIRLIVEYGFRTFDIDRIFARPFGSNERSQRVLQKAGFTLEASFEGTVMKNGRREDEVYYAIRQ